MAAKQSSSKSVSTTDSIGPLQVAALEKFIPQFASQAKVLFLRGSDGRPAICVSGMLQRWGVSGKTLNKLPDMVLHLPRRKLLILLAFDTPITTKQRDQFERLLAACPAKREYVSALSGWQEYGQARNSFAWNTHVWLAEVPGHMMHYNGAILLGPQRRRK